MAQARHLTEVVGVELLYEGAERVFGRGFDSRPVHHKGL